MIALQYKYLRSMFKIFSDLKVFQNSKQIFVFEQCLIALSQAVIEALKVR